MGLPPRHLSARPLPRARRARPPRRARTGRPTRHAPAPIRLVRRQFEALRPRREIHARASPTATNSTSTRWSARAADLRAGSGGSDRVYLAMRAASARSRGHAAGRRLALDRRLGRRITACSTSRRRRCWCSRTGLRLRRPPRILTFTSRRRSWVRLETVKDFDEPMSACGRAPHRGAEAGLLHPHRRGRAPCRGRRSRRQPQRKKLLLVLTDGKPNDIDHYEGRYAHRGHPQGRAGGAAARCRGVRRHGRRDRAVLLPDAVRPRRLRHRRQHRPAARRPAGDLPATHAADLNCSKEELARRVVCASANSRLCPSAYVARDQDRPLAIQITKRPDRRDQVRGDWIDFQKSEALNASTRGEGMGAERGHQERDRQGGRLAGSDGGIDVINRRQHLPGAIGDARCDGPA